MALLDRSQLYQLFGELAGLRQLQMGDNAERGWLSVVWDARLSSACPGRAISCRCHAGVAARAVRSLGLSLRGRWWIDRWWHEQQSCNNNKAVDDDVRRKENIENWLNA